MKRIAIAFASALASAPAVASCGSAFCLVNTSWDMHGAWAPPGLRLDLRYEDIRQDRLQEGRRRIVAGEVPRDHDEVLTANHNWLANLDYTFNDRWGVSVALPVVDRRHEHLQNDPDRGMQTAESWKFTQLGDVRVLARYRLGTWEGGGSELGTAGVNFGVKLPTGKHDVLNADGEAAERTLQPGTGTTGALLGAYYSQLLPASDLSWFAQALLQVPLNARDGFEPGARLGLDAGLRYELGPQVSLLLQANALVRERDSGIRAEPGDSGGRWLFLSPGASIALSRDVSLYGFLQAPLYQYVNGVQLVAHKGVVVGISAKF